MTPAVLVDTSVWVEYLRGTTSRATVELRGLLDTDAPRVVMCEPVAMELLAGAIDEPMLRRLERLVNGLRSLPVDPSLDFRVAADLFRRCRSGGLTVRNLTDCLIAAVALRHDVELVHQDADYEALSRVAPLKTRSVR